MRGLNQEFAKLSHPQKCHRFESCYFRQILIAKSKLRVDNHNTMKKILWSACLLMGLASSVFAGGNVSLGWDLYTNDVTVDTIKIYAAPGTNVFTNGTTAGATIIATTSSTNTSLTVSNLTSGYWSFCATAYSSTNNLESFPTTNQLSSKIVPAAPANFKIISVFVK